MNRSPAFEEAFGFMWLNLSIPRLETENFIKNYKNKRLIL